MAHDVSESLQQQLRESQERFELAVRCSNDGIWDWDLASDVVYYSPRWKSMLGYRDDEIEHRYDEWRSRVHPEDLERVLAAIQSHLAGETEFYGVEMRMRHKDGSYRWIAARGASLRDERGRAYRFAGSHTDITDRRRSDEELRQSEQRYRSLFEHHPDAVFAFDLEGHFTSVNGACSELSGYSAEELLRLGWTDVVCPEMVERTRVQVEQAVAGKSQRFESAIRHKDGRRVDVAATTTPIVVEGEVVGLYGIARDITDWKQAEEALRGSYEMLEQRVADRTRELSTLLDLSYTVSSTLEIKPLLELIVDGLKEVADYDGASLLLREGDHLTFFDRQGPDPGAELSQTRIPIHAYPGFWDRFVAGEAVIIEDVQSADPLAVGWRLSVGPLAETTFKYVHGWMGVPLLLKGEILGLLTLASAQKGHFTERHATLALAAGRQAAVAVENARLYEQGRQWAAAEERARLARELHDSVTQALFSMTLHARTTHMYLEREGIDPTSPLALSVRQLSDLTQGALAEMRALLFELRPGALREEGLVAALRKQAAALTAREEVKVDVQAPPGRISLDERVEEQLYRLSQEALHNVVKHAQATHVQLCLSLTEDAVTLEVTDDGVGFDPAERHPGHMGLSTMAERAASLGGDLEVRSTPGDGTVIRVAVPMLEEDDVSIPTS